MGGELTARCTTPSRPAVGRPAVGRQQLAAQQLAAQQLAAQQLAAYQWGAVTCHSVLLLPLQLRLPLLLFTLLAILQQLLGVL